MESKSYPRILRLPEVCKLTGLSKSAIYRKMAAGTFPKQIKIAERSMGWIEEEILAWIKARIAQSRTKSPELVIPFFATQCKDTTSTDKGEIP